MISPLHSAYESDDSADSSDSADESDDSDSADESDDYAPPRARPTASGFATGLHGALGARIGSEGLSASSPCSAKVSDDRIIPSANKTLFGCCLVANPRLPDPPSHSVE